MTDGVTLVSGGGNWFARADVAEIYCRYSLGGGQNTCSQLYSLSISERGEVKGKKKRGDHTVTPSPLLLPTANTTLEDPKSIPTTVMIYNTCFQIVYFKNQDETCERD